MQKGAVVLLLMLTAATMIAAPVAASRNETMTLSLDRIQPQPLAGVKLRVQHQGLATDAIDTLRNDDNTPAYFYRYNYYWLARLTPASVCSLQTIQIYKYALDTLGWVAGCSLYIFADTVVNNHSYPGRLVASGYGVDTLAVGYNVLISNYNATGIVAGPAPFWVGWKCIPIVSSDTLFPLLDNGTVSWRNALSLDRTQWFEVTAGDFFHRAVVNYFSTAATHDVGIAGIGNSRGFFLNPGQNAVISCDVFNGGDTVEAGFPVVCSVYTETGTPVTGFTETFPLDITPGDTVPYVFNTQWQPTTAGVYFLKVKTARAGDARPNNDMQLREAQVCGSSAVLRYDDNLAPDNAWALYNAGGMFLNKFVPPSYPVFIDSLYYHFWASTWPSPGGNGAIFEVWLDSAGIPRYQVFCETTTVNRGAWNTVALPTPIRVDSAAFLVGYRQTADYPNCPGLSTDDDPPYSVQGWLLVGDTWYYNANPEGDYKIRAAIRQAGGPPPQAGWTEITQVPLSPSGKAVKDGGALAFDAGTSTIYVLKGNKTGDFYSYDGTTWTTLTPMPPGTEAKLPSKGANICTDGNGTVYATKGNNTLGFWKYSGGTWTQLTDVPTGASNKKVKGGTDLVYVDDGESTWVYLLKGYGTEFYRYSTASGAWYTLTDAPAGAKAKYDKGSWLVYDVAGGKLYAHKAKYSEMYAYDLATGSWGSQLAGIPLQNSQTGKSKKAKDGSDGVILGGVLYALKGGNTQDFYACNLTTGAWTEKETIPAIGSTQKKKRVKGGGGITTDGVYLYALKGNKTVELWRYGAGTFAAGSRQNGVMTESFRNLQHGLRLSANPVVAGVVSVHYALPKSGPATLRLCDITGRTVLMQTLAAERTGTVNLNVGSLPTGIYLLRFDAEGWTGARKLIVRN